MEYRLIIKNYNGVSITWGGTAIAISSSGSCFICVYLVYLERGKCGNKGWVICRAVGSQVIFATPYGPAAYALRPSSGNVIYSLYWYRQVL